MSEFTHDGDEPPASPGRRPPVQGAGQLGSARADRAAPREPATFAGELRALRTACGSPSYATLHRGSTLLPPATISDSLTGRVTPRLEFVLAFVRGCLRHAEDRGLTVDPTLADLDHWRQRWIEVRRAADEARRGRVGAAPPDSAPNAPDPAPGGPEPGSAAASPSPEVEATAPPWQLPNPVRQLYGRGDDMAWLTRTILEELPAQDAGTERMDRDQEDFGRAPVVVLEGMGGVGKTVLAVAWGHRHRDAFPDGQLFADLGGFGPGVPADPAQVLGTFVRALGAPPGSIPGDIDGLAGLFRSLCADRRILVLLDNAAGAEQILPLLPASRGAAAIVTTRGSMPGLMVRADARRRVLNPLRDEDAIALLAHQLPDLGADRLRRLASVCGNLPLALRLAASRLADGGVDADLDAVIDRPGDDPAAGLMSALTDPADPHCDLPAVLSWTVDGIPPAESRALLLLAGSPGAGFDDHAAAALIGLPVSPARRLLAALSGRHLIDRVRHGGWRMHDLIRAWSREEGRRTLGPGQRADAVRRLLGYYLWTADTVDRTLLPQRGRPELESALPVPLSSPRITDEAEALAWGDAAMASIVDVINAAREAGEPRCAATIPHILMSYLNLRKPWAQWIAMCRIGLQAAAEIDDQELSANLHIAAGIAHRETRALPRAIEEFTAAADGFRRSGNTIGVAMTLNNLATVHQQSGDPDRAREVLLRAVDELGDGADPFRRAIVLHNLAEAEVDLGRLQRALQHADQALAAELDAGDDLGAATTRTTRGRIQMLLGRRDLAEAEFRAALQVQRTGGDRLGQATTQRRLGTLLLESDRPAEAVTDLSEAAQILTELEDPAAPEVAALHDRARRALAQSSTRQ